MPHQHHQGHQHHHVEKRQDQATVVQYVYQTAEKTFDGPVAGYSTINAPPAAGTPQVNADTSNSDSNANANANSNENDSSDSNSQQQQAAQQQAAAESSSSVVAAQLAEASSSAVVAAKASMEAAAKPTPSPTQSIQIEQQTGQQTQEQTEDQAQTTPKSTTEKTKASVKETPASSPFQKLATPSAAAAATSSPQAAVSSPTSSFIESTSSSTPSNTAAASSGSSSGGTSGGAKAGIAIGVLLAIGLLAAGIFLCIRRRKKQANKTYGKADDEKSAYAGGLARAQSTTSTRTTATAPRLSLRPVTQFLPDLAARGKAANAAGAAAAGPASGAVVAKKDNDNPANPFGNHAEVAQPPQSFLDNEKTALAAQDNTPENPFTDSAGTAPPPTNASVLPPTVDVPAPLRVRTPTPETAAAAGAGAAALGAGAVAATKPGERDNAPKPLNLTPNRAISPAMPSPAASEFSQTSVSPAPLANGPPPSNVHRIQLDFKPSMDDELSLRAGQLVRLLHEYDDGWALCIRLDRSQQGVAPRTCLSARPVKPRPPPGARGPGPRGPPPGIMGPGQRPASPASGRGSPSPYTRSPRPIGPGPNGSQQRSMSPGPYGGGPQRPANIPPPGGKRRSSSASDLRDHRQSPPGPSPMNPNVQRVPMQLQAVTSPDQVLSQSPPQTMAHRKPVPGQAM